MQKNKTKQNKKTIKSNDKAKWTPWIKSNDKTKWIPWKNASFPNLTQSSLVPIQLYGQSELDWGFGILTCFQGSHFVCEGEGSSGVARAFPGGRLAHPEGQNGEENN